MLGGPGVGLHQLRIGALGSLYVEVILKLGKPRLSRRGRVHTQLLSVKAFKPPEEHTARVMRFSWGRGLGGCGV